MTTFILLCYFIFCVCFWHIWSFPIFFCCSAGDGKNRFSPRTSDYRISASMYTGKLICGGEKSFPLIGNQRSIKITFTESSFRELFPHNLYEVEKIMQFSTTINHYKPKNEWMNEIHHYVPLTMQRSPPPPIEQEGKSIFVMKHSKEYFFTLKKVF